VRSLSAWRWSLCLAVVAAVAPAVRGEQPSPGETAPVWDVVTLSNGDEIRCRVVDHNGGARKREQEADSNPKRNTG